MFRLHGNGRDQTRPHRHRAVSDLHPPTLLLRTERRSANCPLPHLSLSRAAGTGSRRTSSGRSCSCWPRSNCTSTCTRRYTRTAEPRPRTRSILIQQCGVVVPHSAIIIILLMLIAVFSPFIYDTVKGTDRRLPHYFESLILFTFLFFLKKKKARAQTTQPSTGLCALPRSDRRVQWRSMSSMLPPQQPLGLLRAVHSKMEAVVAPNSETHSVLMSCIVPSGVPATPHSSGIWTFSRVIFQTRVFHFSHIC